MEENQREKEAKEENVDMDKRLILIGPTNSGGNMLIEEKNPNIEPKRQMKINNGLDLSEYVYCFHDREMVKKILVFQTPAKNKAYQDLIKILKFESSVTILVYSINSNQTLKDVIQQYYEPIKALKTDCKFLLVGTGEYITEEERKQAMEEANLEIKGKKFKDVFIISPKNINEVNRVLDRAAKILYESNGCCPCF
jgi:hypothetical protein